MRLRLLLVALAVVVLLAALVAVPSRGAGIVILDKEEDAGAADKKEAATPALAEAEAEGARPKKGDGAGKGGVAAAGKDAAGSEDGKPATSRMQPACDLVAEEGICLGGGRKVLAPSAGRKAVVGSWTFDSAMALDESGYANHAAWTVPAGPGRFGAGASAYCVGDDLCVEVPESESIRTVFAGKGMALSFWIYLRPDSSLVTEEQCGLAAVSDALQVGIVPGTGRFWAASDRGATKLTSQARLRPGQWTHVMISSGQSRLTLYVNGVPDASAKTSGAASTAYANANVYAGRLPADKPVCHLSAYIDDLRLMRRPANQVDAAAESFGSLPVEASYVRLGAPDGSTRSEAQKSCTDSYHLCTQNELYAGGLQAARAMGWIDGNSNVFSADKNEAAEKGVGICCAD